MSGGAGFQPSTTSLADPENVLDILSFEGCQSQQPAVWSHGQGKVTVAVQVCIYIVFKGVRREQLYIY